MVNYRLDLNPVEQDLCGGPEGLEEAVEFAMRTNTSGPWIPLRLTWRQSSQSNPQDVYGTETIRGYTVATRGVTSNIFFALPLFQEQVTICGETVLPENAEQVQFRWMNTANEPGHLDIWAIFNITVNFNSLTGDTYEIFEAKNFK